MANFIPCGAQLASEEDVWYGYGIACGEKATHRCLDYKKRNVYRCAKHATVFSSRVPIEQTDKDPNDF